MWGHGLRTQYSARILLPRLFMGAVLINFSLPLFQAVVDMTNTLCVAIKSFVALDSPSDWLANSVYGPSAGIWEIVTTAILAVGYDVLAITYLVRYAILIVLAITAPIAGLLFMLPETHHISKQWASNFTSNLLMQPAQLFVIAVGFGLEKDGTTPIHHLFALASLLLVFKVPGALGGAEKAAHRLQSTVTRGISPHRARGREGVIALFRVPRAGLGGVVHMDRGRLSGDRATRGCLSVASSRAPSSARSSAAPAVELEPFDPFCPGHHIHTGIDLAAPAGTPVSSATAGTARTGLDPGGAGMYVDGDRRLPRADPVLPPVRVPGAQRGFLSPGQVLGLVGSTGLATGPHVHLEVQVDGRSVDPAVMAWRLNRLGWNRVPNAPNLDPISRR